MRLITNRINNGHVSCDTIDEFEKLILSDNQVQPVKLNNSLIYSLKFFIYRFCRKFGFSTIHKTAKRFSANPVLDRKHLFTVMMGLDIYKYRPFGLYTSHNRSIYLFDAWPHDFDDIIQFVAKFKIDFIFVSASESAKYLRLMLDNKKVHWIPEGINVDEYKYIDYNKKNIDILSLGRKYDLYHEKIVDKLKENQTTYLYEKIKGELIFPTRNEFIEGLANTKISICIPSNITHPQRSGSIETMTIRYLQSIVSKCLIVGHAPEEMIELFGYNPVIEIDYNDPVDQLKDILSHYMDYIPFIEKNYQQVLQNHTWQNRWNQMIKIWSASSL